MMDLLARSGICQGENLGRDPGATCSQQTAAKNLTYCISLHSSLHLFHHCHLPAPSVTDHGMDQLSSSTVTRSGACLVKRQSDGYSGFVLRTCNPQRSGYMHACTTFLLSLNARGQQTLRESSGRQSRVWLPWGDTRLTPWFRIRRISCEVFARFILIFQFTKARYSYSTVAWVVL